jgi:iron complex outermembrane receptor protein
MHAVSRAVALVLAASLVASLNSIACAQEAPAAEGAPDDASFDTIVVLGTARADTTALTSTAPVDVITPTELKETGAVTINQALSKLHPSFNFPQGQNAVKGQGVRAASLRGVGPAYTLVLVNGKRRNVSAQLTGTDPWPAAQVVDINTIPVSAVERVEVLRDGAAAQYGSDAIAGVINIVLKRDADASEVGVRYGGYTDGGGETTQVVAHTGFGIGDRGFVNLSLDRLYNSNVDRSEADWRQLFPNGDARNTTYPKKYGQWGQGQRNNWAGLVNAGYELADGVQLYGWANYADKSSYNYVNPERVVKANTQSATATNGARVSETAVLDLYPNGYQPIYTYAAKDYSLAGGVKWTHATLGALDFGVSAGRNETGRYGKNAPYASWGAAGGTEHYFGSWISQSTSVTADWTHDLPLPFVSSAVASAGALYRHEKWSVGDYGDYETYAPGPLAGQTIAQLYGPGGIYNKWAAQFPGVNFATDTSVVPASGFGGVNPLDDGSATRKVKGGYLGVDSAITDKLDVGLTGRFEDYSDFGSTTNYRVTARYEFVPAIALRGTVSSGFHAPSLAALGQQTTAYTSTFTNNGSSVLTPGRTRQFRSQDPVAAAFGAKPLEPEESTTFSLGVVLRPDETSSITIDAYRLDVKDVITVTDPIQGATVSAAFTAAGLPGYTQATYYLNAWDQRTDGVDIVGRKRLGLGDGNLDLTAAASFLSTDTRNVNSTVQVGTATITVVGNARLRDAESGTPRNKQILSGRYSLGPWSVEATGTRYAPYRYNVGNVPGVATANGNIDQEFSSESYFDLGFSYTTSQDLRLDLQVQNVLNDYPDKYVTGNRSSGINPYSFIAPNGASGRFVQLGASWTF